MLWLNHSILNTDGTALYKGLVLNQTEQGFRHFWGCAVLLSLSLRPGLGHGGSAAFDLSPTEAKASQHLVFYFSSPKHQNFHYNGFCSAITFPGLFPSYPIQYLFSQQPQAHTCALTAVYDLMDDESSSRNISKHKNYKTAILEKSCIYFLQPSTCHVPANPGSFKLTSTVSKGY